jgi:4-hydroxy-4-methyl-2-oxoglutarate aldolase
MGAMSDSFTFGELPPPPPAELIEELRGFEIAWISDAMELHLMDHRIRPIHPRISRVVGPAITVTVPPGDFVMIAAALKTARPGDVLVVDARGDTSRAVWGDYLSGWAQGLGVAAIVIDGAARDVEGIEAIGFPVFARATIPRKPTISGHGEINVPVSCGGVCVIPGDIVIADREGAIVIPSRHLARLLPRLRETADRERSHNGMPAGGRAEYDAFYEKSFAPRVAAAPPLGEV